MTPETPPASGQGSGLDRRLSISQILGERPLWVLLALVLLFFARPVFLGQTFFFRDLTLLAFPQRERLVELVRSSGLPLWDPYLHGGQPFLGNVNNLPLYPTALLYFFLPHVTAFNLEIVLHFLLCGFAAYWLSRVLGLSPTSSLITGAAFVLCGFTLSVANLLNRLLATPNVLLLLLFWHLFLTERKNRWFLGAVASGALVILAGSVEFLVLSMAIALGWALVYPYPPESAPRPRRVLFWCVMGAAILGVAAVQIGPQIEVIRQSNRGSGIYFLNLSYWSLNPRRLPELFVPRFLGSTPSLFDKEYWGDRVEDGGRPLILSIYFGIPVLALALLGGLARGSCGLSKRFRRFLLFVAAAALLLGLGRFLFLSHAFYRIFPLGGLFRYPIKALAAAPLPLALLAACAVDGFANVSRFGHARQGRWGVLSLSLVALALGGAAIALEMGAIPDSLERWAFLMPLERSHRPILAAAFFHACAAAAALVAILTIGTRPAARRWLLPALGVLVVLDLGIAGFGINPYAPRALLTGEPAIVKRVRQDLGQGRLFRDQTPSLEYQAPTNDVFWRYVLLRETLDLYTGSAFGIPVIFHEDYDFLAQRRLVRLTSILQKLPWEQRLPLLSAGSVTMILTPERPAVPGLELVAPISNPSDVPLFLYRNLLAAPRVGFVANSAFVASETDALRAVLSRGFDPRRHLVVEGSAPFVRGPGCAPASIVELERRPSSWRGRVTSVCDGYLVFSEPFYEGWRGTVDGSPTAFLHANVAFSALAVPAGTHDVTRTYRPTSLLVGALLSAATIAVLVVWAFTARRRPPALPAPRDAEPEQTGS